MLEHDYRLHNVPLNKYRRHAVAFQAMEIPEWRSSEGVAEKVEMVFREKKRKTSIFKETKNGKGPKIRPSGLY